MKATFLRQLSSLRMAGRAGVIYPGYNGRAVREKPEPSGKWNLRLDLDQRAAARRDK